MPDMSREMMVEPVLELMNRPKDRKLEFNKLIELAVEAEKKSFRQNR